MKRRDEDNPYLVNDARKVPRRRPVGHPKMTGQRGIDKDLADLNIMEEQADHKI